MKKAINHKARLRVALSTEGKPRWKYLSHEGRNSMATSAIYALFEGMGARSPEERILRQFTVGQELDAELTLTLTPVRTTNKKR